MARLCESEAPMNDQLILVASKEAKHRKLFEILLTHAGYTVVTAEYPLEVLEILKTVSPSFILMDVHLNEQRSPTLIDELRANQETHALCVFAMTIFQEQWNEQKACAAGYQGLIALPVEPVAFLARLRNVLN
jgi:CheY-like chemotaxis protein